MRSFKSECGCEIYFNEGKVAVFDKCKDHKQHIQFDAAVELDKEYSHVYPDIDRIALKDLLFLINDGYGE